MSVQKQKVLNPLLQKPGKDFLADTDRQVIELSGICHDCCKQGLST